MAEVPEHVRAVIDSMPQGLKNAHERLIKEIKTAARDGRSLIILADKDPDGASAHGLASIARDLGVKDVTVRHVDRDEVRFTEPATYVVYDISVEERHLKGVNPRARIVNIDHHDLVPKGGFQHIPSSWLSQIRSTRTVRGKSSQEMKITRDTR